MLMPLVEYLYCLDQSSWSIPLFTVFIRVSAHPRISAHNQNPLSFPLTARQKNWISSPKTEFCSEYFTETLFCYIFAFCYYHLLFCCEMNIPHLLKMEKI